MARVRPRVVQRKSKPKSMSIGVFAGGVLWLIFITVFGYHLWDLLVACVFSFVVDVLVSGSSSKEDVYID